MDSAIQLLSSLHRKRFHAVSEQRTRNESQDCMKNGASKRAGRGGGERKEMRADKTQGFKNCPLGLSGLSTHTNI